MIALLKKTHSCCIVFRPAQRTRAGVPQCFWEYYLGPPCPGRWLNFDMRQHCVVNRRRLFCTFGLDGGCYRILFIRRSHLVGCPSGSTVLVLVCVAVTELTLPNIFSVLRLICALGRVLEEGG